MKLGKEMRVRPYTERWALIVAVPFVLALIVWDTMSDAWWNFRRDCREAWQQFKEAWRDC